MRLTIRNITNTDSNNMKRFIYIAAICIVALASCTRPYETDFDFCLDRDECRFPADSGQSYFRVFGEGKWTATFEQEVEWLSIDKTEGLGESQVMVFHKKNSGLSRGINLFIDHEDGSRKTIYLSQKSGLGSDTPAYSIATDKLKLLSLNMDVSVQAISNISSEAVDSASVKTIYSGSDSTWINNLRVTPEEVSLAVSANESGAERSAKIQIAFNGATWAEPYTVFLNITQGSAGPEISLSESYELDPLGTKTLEVKINSNWDPALYSYDLSDFSISDNSLFREVEYVDSTSTLKLLPVMNKSKNERTVTLTWNAKDSNGNIVSTASTVLTQDVSPIQIDGEPINLTEGGKFANCYILPDHSDSYYVIVPKLVSGVLPAEDITDARLIWQTAEGILEYVAYSGNEGLLYIYKPEGVKGSAIVALTSAEGKIVWSFHFWATDEVVGECTIGGYTFMDRNIGAITTSAPSDGECDAVGVFYQWGRKDPFPCPATYKVSGGSGALSEVYPSDAIVLKTEQKGVSLETSIENPATWYWGSDNSGSEDWSATQDDNYWNTSAKTDYDPCPYGYVVPDKTGIEALIKSKSSAKANYGWVLTCDDGQTSYLPLGGWFRRKIHATSQFAHVGQEPHYWSTTTGKVDDDCIGSFATTKSTSSVSANARRWGATVRCVKVNNQ